jgi:lipopolysaccharide export system protein LptC
MSQISEDAYLDEEPPPEPRRPRLRYSPKEIRDTNAFEKAERHSGLVRRLRYILPALAIAGVVVFWGTARFIPGDLASLIKVSGIDVNNNSVVMQKPHISGFEGTRRAYDVTAATAVQSLDDPKVVTFNGILAHFGLEDGSAATVSATTGVYDGKINGLTLRRGVVATTTSGYSAKLTNAFIDLGGGGLSTKSPVELTTAEGTLKANTMTVTERGKRVLFTNGVSVTYIPKGDLVPPIGGAAANAGAPDGAGTATSDAATANP